MNLWRLFWPRCRHPVWWTIEETEAGLVQICPACEARRTLIIPKLKRIN